MKSGVVWICAAWEALCAAGVHGAPAAGSPPPLPAAASAPGADDEQGLLSMLEERRGGAMAAFRLAGDGSQDYKRDSQFNKWSR